MKYSAPVFAILLFCVFTDWVQSDWPHAVFRASACALGAAYLLMGRRRVACALLPIALIAAWGFVQLALNCTVWRYATWLSALQWIAYGALFFAALQAVQLRSQLRLFAWFGGAFSLYAIVQYSLWRGPAERMLGSFLNHNHYAAFIELLFPVALWRLFRDRTKAMLALCAALMAVSVAMGGSRAGMLLMIAEAAYVGVRVSRKPWLVLGGVLVSGALVGGFMWVRFALLTTNEPYQSRDATAQASLLMIRDKPLTGFGLGTWASVYPAYAVRDTGFRLIHADDDWLEWAAEGGLPLAAAMIALAAFAFRAAWKQPWCAGCVAVMLHSAVEFPLQKQSVWACYLVLLAAAQPFAVQPLRARRND